MVTGGQMAVAVIDACNSMIQHDAARRGKIHWNGHHGLDIVDVLLRFQWVLKLLFLVK
jgi:hypothetical protein